MAELSVPVELKNNSDKYEYLMNVKEQLRELYNTEGEKFSDGLTTQSTWNAWKSDYFMPRSHEVEKKLCEMREILRFSNKYSIDMDKDFK